MEPDSEFSFVGRWPQIEALLGGAGQIDALARATGALKRPREVRDGSQLLRLALGYAATGRSLRTTAAWSASALGVELSDVALLGRLYETGDFLASLTTGLLARLCRVAAPSETWQGPPIRLVDGSMFAGPGRKGGQRRLHASYDPARQMFTTFDLTSHSQQGGYSRAGQGSAGHPARQRRRHHPRAGPHRTLAHQAQGDPDQGHPGPRRHGHADHQSAPNPLADRQARPALSAPLADRTGLQDTQIDLRHATYPSQGPKAGQNMDPGQSRRRPAHRTPSPRHRARHSPLGPTNLTGRRQDTASASSAAPSSSKACSEASRPSSSTLSTAASPTPSTSDQENDETSSIPSQADYLSAYGLPARSWRRGKDTTPV